MYFYTNYERFSTILTTNMNHIRAIIYVNKDSRPKNIHTTALDKKKGKLMSEWYLAETCNRNMNYALSG